MSFDRARWLAETLADAESDPAANAAGWKKYITALALLADEDGIVDIKEYEEYFRLEPGHLADNWGARAQLAFPESPVAPGDLEMAQLQRPVPDTGERVAELRDGDHDAAGGEDDQLPAAAAEGQGPADEVGSTEFDAHPRIVP